MFNILHIIVSIALIALILIQERSSGLSGVLGGSQGTPYHTRRGVERAVFIGTIILTVLFAGLTLVNLALHV